MLIAVPVYIVRRFRGPWKMPEKLFSRAGLCLIVIEIFHYSVMSQVLSMWTDFPSLPLIVQSAFLGLAAGLFFELGRFLVLDKLFSSVRSYKDAVYFGLGWNGVETFIVGLLLIVAVFGINMLVTTDDVTSIYPDADKTQIEQIELFRASAIKMVNDEPYMGIVPVVERGTFMLMDVALTLIILFGFSRGTNVYAWYSVLFRAAFVGAVFAAQKINPLAGELMFLIFAAAAYAVIWRMKQFYIAEKQPTKRGR